MPGPIVITTPVAPSQHKTRLARLAIGSVMMILLLLLLQVSWSAPAEDQLIAKELGCRSDARLLLLTIQRDGSVLWPDGGTCSVEEAAQQLPQWCRHELHPVLAIKAGPEILLHTVKPLLHAAKNLEMGRVIFAATDQGDIRIFQRF